MPAGPDACLGWVPGVFSACCGHGDRESAFAYLGRDNEHRHTIIKGQDALDFFEIVAKGELVTPGDDSGPRATRTGCPLEAPPQRP